MRKSSHRAIAFVVALVAAAPSAFADMSTVTFSDSWGSTGGGEFLITPSNFSFTPVSMSDYRAGEHPGMFETFCIEKEEHIAYNTEYHVDINTYADNGGGGAVGGQDPLDERTAYLYREFITGQLAGYDYDNLVSRTASADALQHVIWYIEDEENKSWTDNDNSLEDMFYQDAMANANGIGNVRVMNVWGNAAHTHHRQDQLIMVAPAPGAALLAMLGFGVIGRVRRRTA